MKLSEYFNNQDSFTCKVGDSIIVGINSSPACTNFVVTKVIEHPNEPLIALMPLSIGYNMRFKWLPRDSKLKDFKIVHDRYMEFDDKRTNTIKSGTILATAQGHLYIIFKDGCVWNRGLLTNPNNGYAINCTDAELNETQAIRLLSNLHNWYTCDIKIEK